LNVLVTGGTSGIGQAIAVRFAEYGANVAINYLRAPTDAKGTEEKVHACLERVRQMGVRDVLVQGDVSDEGDVLAMVDSVVDQLGGRHCIQPGADCLRDNAPDAVWSYPPIENPSACFGIDDRLSQQLVQLQNLDPALLHFEGEVVVVLLRLLHPDDIVKQQIVTIARS